MNNGAVQERVAMTLALRDTKHNRQPQLEAVLRPPLNSLEKQSYLNSFNRVLKLSKGVDVGVV